MKRSQPAQLAALGVLIVIYVAVRFWGLTASCLWFDEIFGVHAAEHAWGDLFSFVALDLIHPPLFYVLLKLWIVVAGEALGWLRAFPVVFALAALIPFFGLCRELKLDGSTRLLALFLLAVNGSLIKYAQEVRMYSLLMCLSLFSIWLFVRYFIKGKSLASLIIVNILLVYTHYFGWFLIGTEVFAVLVLQPIKWRAVLTMFGITFSAFLPWLAMVYMAAPSSTAIGENIGWMQRPGAAAITQFKLNLIEPFYYAATSVDPFSIYRITLPLMAVFTVAIILYFAGWNKQPEDDKQSVYLLISFAAAPVALAFITSWIFPYSIWGTRHLIIVFTPVALLLAIAATKMGQTNVRTAVLTLVLLFSGYAFVVKASREEPRYEWCAWEQLVGQIDRRGAPVEILTFEDLNAYHLWFATRYDPAVPVIKVDGTGIAEDKAYFLPRGFESVAHATIEELNAGIYWLAFRQDAWDENRPPISLLKAKGYKFDNPIVVRVDRSHLYLVRATK